MSSSRLLAVFIVIVLLAAAVIGIYALVQGRQAQIQSQWTPLPPAATSTPAASTTSMLISLPSATTSVPAAWKTYDANSAGYQIAYPPDLAVNDSGSSVALVFPKDIYFHWPLQDDAVVTVSSAAVCQPLNTWGGFDMPASAATLGMGGLVFTVHEGSGAGAGQRFEEATYDTAANGACYRIDFTDSGATDAGLYVDDQSLIAQYNNQHSVDLGTVIAAVDSIVASFRVTPRQ